MMANEEEYGRVVEALHDAALAIEADDDLKISALINVAVEAALAIHGPEGGRRLLIDMLKDQLAAAAEHGLGESGYYSERH
jgi:hypothetical protein